MLIYNNILKLIYDINKKYIIKKYKKYNYIIYLYMK